MRNTSRRKKHQEFDPHLERWLVSYADFVTLLFAFFVVMYSISSVNEGKHRVLSDSLNENFKTQPSSQSVIDFKNQLSEQVINNSDSLIELPVPTYEDLSTKDEKLDSEENPTLNEINQEVGEAVESLMEQGMITISQNDNWLEIDINSSILFESGGSIVSEDAEDILFKLASIIRVYPNQIQIEGYTDNIPINTSRFPSNWELSSARAASVVHIFEEGGVNPKKMQAIGFGQHHPKVSNDTPEGRMENRRVAVVVMGNQNTKRVKEIRPNEANQLKDVETDRARPISF